MRDAILCITDILAAITAIEKFIEGIDCDSFRQNDEKSSAVIRKLEIIGEAVKNLSVEIKDQNPDIPWKEMAGFRDKLIHFYFGLKYELIWETIRNRLPQLKGRLEKIYVNIKESKKK
ncbi:MAG: hypothetical protein A2096_07180 [Spirochaetes bacterium GWF1_41_5]|nr:MAG: hypothetical protein A2096_07180 [Spirochaetes bacterium GWF1_41_5]HBE04610.1 hypothetical protein [Spirochaetia bacterium]